MDYGFIVEITKKNIRLSGITYYEWGDVEEEIGVFTFDKIIYKQSNEYLAIKKIKKRKSKIWKDVYSNVVKLIYLNIYVDDLIWCWLLTEDWSESEIKNLDEQEYEKILDRFRDRRDTYNEEFFGGRRVLPYIRYKLLQFKIIERLNAPDALVISSEPIERYFKPATLFIDIS